MSYARYSDLLRFPSGRSVRNCRGDVERMLKSPLHESKLNQCLDEVAVANGVPQGWSYAQRHLLDEAVHRTAASSAQISQQQLAQLARKHPKLTRFGIGVWGDLVSLWGKPYAEIVTAENADLSACIIECRLALAYVNLLQPQRALNRRATRHSYELKHLAERALGKFMEYPYVSNGAFIAAAIFRGFLPEHVSKRSLSVYLNIDEASPVLHWDGDMASPVARALEQQIDLAMAPVSS